MVTVQTRQNWNNSRKSRLAKRFKRVETLLETVPKMGTTYMLVKMGYSEAEIEAQKVAIRKVFRQGIDTLIVVEWED